MKRKHEHGGSTLLEILVTMVVLTVLVLGASAFRYYAAADTRKGDTRSTATRLALMLLDGWKGHGGASAYSLYALEDPDDYDATDPQDYNPSDTAPAPLGPGLSVFDSAPGPPVPDDFSALDAQANPNYRIVVDDFNYYATLSYNDQSNKPRLLCVCVAWMETGQLWDNSQSYKTVQLCSYADN